MSEAVWDGMRFDYVLVIELLNPEEERTGKMLIDKLQDISEVLQFELKVCNNLIEVVNAIKEAELNIKTKGIPIIHFEAHGLSRSDENPGGIGFNGNNNYTGVFISWNELWEPLRQLNLATDFNLIVVAAACSGDDIAYGLVHDYNANKEPPVPFMATIGFVSTVKWKTLMESMISFYRSLVSNSILHEAIIKANSQLNESEKLSYQWTIGVFLSVLQHFTPEDRSGDADYYWGKFLNENPNTTKNREDFLLEIIRFEPSAKELLLSKMLCYEKFPHNRDRWKLL
jgi:hypothetical protein